MIAAIALLRGHWKMIAVGLLLALLCVQQLRVMGLKSSISIEKASRVAEREGYKRAQAEAGTKALIAKQEQEARYAKAAQTADAAHVRQLDEARNAADRYIAANRVRPCAGSSTSRSAPAAQDRSANVPEETAPMPVLVSEQDVRICSAVTAYAIESHNWAKTLETAQ